MFEKLNAYGFPVSDKGTQDERMLAREVFNPYDCPLVFTSLLDESKWNRRERVCLPGKFRFLPHGYYRVQFQCGFKGWKQSPFNALVLDPKKPGEYISVPVNLGDSIGKGLTGDAEELRKRFKHNCCQ